MSFLLLFFFFSFLVITQAPNGSWTNDVTQGAIWVSAHWLSFLFVHPYNSLAFDNLLTSHKPSVSTAWFSLTLSNPKVEITKYFWFIKLSILLLRTSFLNILIDILSILYTNQYEFQSIYWLKFIGGVHIDFTDWNFLPFLSPQFIISEQH